MVSCIFCGEEYHISADWRTTYEEFEVEDADVGIPEIGICSDCRNQKILSEVEEKHPELIRSVEQKLETAFKRELTKRIKKAMADEIARLEAQRNAGKETEKRIEELKRSRGQLLDRLFDHFRALPNIPL
jgi:lipase chaperone LimK